MHHVSRNRFATAWVTCAALAGFFLGPGCAASRTSSLPEIPRGPVVARITVEGNHAFPDSEIIEAISAEATSRVLFWDKKYLDSGELEADRTRVANFYRLHGYFDVSVNPIEVEPYEKTVFRREDAAEPPPAPSLDEALGGPTLGAGEEMAESPADSRRPEESPESVLDATGDAPNPASDSSSGPVSGEEEAEPETEATRARPGVSAGRGEPVQGVMVSPWDEGPEASGFGVEGPDREPDRVALVIQVEEGVRYQVKEVRVQLDAGVQGDPERRGTGGLSPEWRHVHAIIARHITLREGAYFDAAVQQADEAAIRAALHQASYAWAEVSSDILLLPRTGEVRLRYRVVTGPPCFFGQVQIVGLEKVDRRTVMLRVRRHVVPGTPFRQDTLTNLQRALYDLQLFQSVVVGLSEASRGASTVGIEVTVREKAFRQVRTGGGLTQESNWQEIATHAGWTHRYFRNRLVRVSLDALAGWGFSPGIQNRQAFASPECTDQGCTTEGRNGPILDLKTDVSLPDFKGRRVTAGASARFRVGQTISYGYMSPEFKLTASRQMDRHLAVGFAAGLEQYLPTPDAVSQAAFQTSDLENTANDTIRFEGLLTYLQQTVSYDRRDHVLAPERGFYGALTLQEAGLLGDFSFLKAVPDVRFYLPIVPGRLIFTTRYSTGAIVPLAGKSAPPVLYYELGGGATVRGIPWNALTFYTGTGCASPSPTADPDGPCTVATGGTVFHLANLELRIPLGEIGAVTFADAGHVALANDHVLQAWASPSPSDFLLSVGAGLRYRTPVGPIRLDFGYRVHEPVPLAPGFTLFGGSGCRCGIHLAIGEAF